MTIEILTALYFVFFYVCNLMYFLICNRVLDRPRFGKVWLYVVALLNSVLFSVMVYGFNQLPTITYLIVLFGSILQLRLLFINGFAGILMCSLMATIYLVCIESIVISSGALTLGISLGELTHSHLLLFSHIVVSWLVCMLVAICVFRFVPGKYLRIINQNKEQTLFVLGFLFVATGYLTLNSFIYSHADTFDSVYLPLHQVLTPFFWLLVVTLAVVLLVRFDYLHGYKEKSDILQQTVEQQKYELIASKSRAERDVLVDAYNKIGVENKIKEAIEEGVGGAFYILDIDNFKEINDSKGHPFGDKVLVYLSKRIANAFRQQDIVGRIGGDEFVIFQKNVTDAQSVQQRAVGLCRDIRVPFVDENGVSVAVSVSIGIAVFPQDAKDFESLYAKADEALYKAKKKGKNTFFVYGNLLQ